MDDTMNEYLPQVRCSAELKARLRRIAAASVVTDLAAHIRLAVEQYVENDLGQLRKLLHQASMATTDIYASEPVRNEETETDNAPMN